MTTETLVLLFCGSLLTEKLNDVITGISRRLPPENRGGTWEIFAGTGTEGNIIDALVGLMHGGIGKNNAYETALKAANWVAKRHNELAHLKTIIMINYSRGTNTANRAAQLIAHTKLQVHIIDHDNVVGLFGNREMVPPIARNVVSHIRFNAQYSVLPLLPFFLTHQLRYENPQTKRLIFTTNFDHAAAGGTIISFGYSREEFVLKQHPLIQPALVDFMCLALVKMGIHVSLEKDEQAVITGLEKAVSSWEKTSLHCNNYARNHHFDESLWQRFPWIAALSAIALCTLNAPFLIIPLAFLIYISCITIQLILSSLTPASSMGIPLQGNAHVFLKHFETLTTTESHKADHKKQDFVGL